MVRLGVTPLVADVNKGQSMAVVTWPAVLWAKDSVPPSADIGVRYDTVLALELVPTIDIVVGSDVILVCVVGGQPLLLLVQHG